MKNIYAEAVAVGRTEAGSCVEVEIHRPSTEKFTGFVRIDGRCVDSVGGLTYHTEATEAIAKRELAAVLNELNNFEVAVCATCGKLHEPPACGGAR